MLVSLGFARVGGYCWRFVAAPSRRRPCEIWRGERHGSDESGIATFALALTAGTCFGQLGRGDLEHLRLHRLQPRPGHPERGLRHVQRPADGPGRDRRSGFFVRDALTTFVGVLNRTATGSPGDWAASLFLDGPDSESVLVYRTSKVTFVRVVTVAVGGNPPE